MFPQPLRLGDFILKIVCILNRFFMKIIDKTRITAKGVCMNNRNFLMVSIDRFRKGNIKIAAFSFHKLTSYHIVSLKTGLQYGMIYKTR